MNLKTISYKLLGLAIIVAGYFFARMTGVGELMLFTMVISLTMLTYRFPQGNSVYPQGKGESGVLYDRSEAEIIAASLYDGGWGSGNRNDLMKEYGFKRKQAEQICALLKEFEDAGGYAGSEILWWEEISDK